MPVDEGHGYESYDPAEVRPAAEQGRADSPETEAKLLGPDGEPLPHFDSRVKEAFEGLLYLGALATSFTWLGHRFRIRTLNQDELLTVPLLIEPWAESMGAEKAYVVGVVALCVMSVDGKELPIPVGEGPHGDLEWAYQRFDYARRNWYQFTFDHVYNEYLSLEAVVQKVVDAMGEASSPAGSTGGLNATSAGLTGVDSSVVEGSQ